MENYKTLAEIERDAVLFRLKLNGGDKPRTAASLGICVKTLYNRLKVYKLQDLQEKKRA